MPADITVSTPFLYKMGLPILNTRFIMLKKGKRTNKLVVNNAMHYTSRPGAISTNTPYGAIDLISQFLVH